MRQYQNQSYGQSVGLRLDPGQWLAITVRANESGQHPHVLLSNLIDRALTLGYVDQARRHFPGKQLRAGAARWRYTRAVLDPGVLRLLDATANRLGLSRNAAVHLGLRESLAVVEV